MSDEPPKTPVRDHVESLVTAVVLALLIKGFVVDAFRIPTGSMQPTLFGEEKLDLYDRILVDRVSYLASDPERFEVIVFKFPLDQSRNFVKRVVGIGPEELELRGGDLFRRADESEPWSVVRKPAAVQESLLRSMDPVDEASASFGDLPAGWSAEGRSVTTSASAGVARFRPELGTLRDHTLDGYPASIARALEDRVHTFGTHPIGDLRVAGLVTLGAAPSVFYELVEGPLTYRFEISAEGRALITARGGDSQKPPLELVSRTCELDPTRPFTFTAQNIDDLLSLGIDGRWVAVAEIEPTLDQRSEVRLGHPGVSDANAEAPRFVELSVSRDIYYTADRATSSRISVPAGHYYVLGDNTRDSSDSRQWRFTRFEIESEGVDGPRIVRGNTRRDENPITLGAGDPDGPKIRFRDEWGELHWFRQSEGHRLPPEEAPFVPREAIVGRAWAVFWPWKPDLDLLRLRWIR